MPFVIYLQIFCKVISCFYASFSKVNVTILQGLALINFSPWSLSQCLPHNETVQNIALRNFAKRITRQDLCSVGVCESLQRYKGANEIYKVSVSKLTLFPPLQ